MILRVLAAIVATYILWAGTDVLLHQVILGDQYEATKDLWRPDADMQRLFWVYWVGLAITTVCFVLIYARLIRRKCVCNGLWYGLLFGLAGGAGMAYTSYPFSQTPYLMAQIWFIGATVQGILAGLLVALIVRDRSQSESAVTAG